MIRVLLVWELTYVLISRNSQYSVPNSIYLVLVFNWDQQNLHWCKHLQIWMFEIWKFFIAFSISVSFPFKIVQNVYLIRYIFIIKIKSISPHPIKSNILFIHAQKSITASKSNKAFDLFSAIWDCTEFEMIFKLKTVCFNWNCRRNYCCQLLLSARLIISLASSNIQQRRKQKFFTIIFYSKFYINLKGIQISSISSNQIGCNLEVSIMVLKG